MPDSPDTSAQTPGTASQRSDQRGGERDSPRVDQPDNQRADGRKGQGADPRENQGADPRGGQRDYRDTVFLPKTDFPMKAGLPAKEPGILAQMAGRRPLPAGARSPRGPRKIHPPRRPALRQWRHAYRPCAQPCAEGHGRAHADACSARTRPTCPAGTATACRSSGRWKKLYRKKKLDKDQVPPAEFRAECRAYAAHWVDVQREQLKRLGALGDWDNPYLTMQFDSEAGIVAELMKFATSGQLYRGAKPVMWSPVEKTALAEAEVEYEDIVSTQIDVAFEIVESPIPELVGAHAVIWTTTPWTIPVNQALAYGPDVEYVLVTLFTEAHQGAEEATIADERMADNGVPIGTRLLVAEPLLQPFVARLKKMAERLDWSDIGGKTPDILDLFGTKHFKGSDLAGTKVRHPMHSLGGFFAEPRPMLPGDFVTTESGTGLVHMAPDHGEDDFELCREYGIEPKFVVEADGRYREDWGWLPRSDERNASVINPKFNAPDGPICSDLREAGGLLSASADYRHSYPHSWRSKAKVIFRCTPQWFVPMDKGIAGTNSGKTLRQTAMQAISDTRFVPEKGRNRIGSMVEGRPDWVLSRQRAWGVPITLFVDRSTGDYLVDPAVNARIVAAIRAEGVDGWREDQAAALLGPDYAPDDYEMVVDILDVWFDSGSTHAFVLESDRWPDLQSPADLYLEGSDQHRGWFQSSLLESCATRGHAPYKAVLTHGFTMDSAGKKMSKSVGNTVDPNKVMEQYGADIIRLWALTVDFTADHRIGEEILKGVADQYRKLRNTFRYLLGALDGFEERERVTVEDMPELERYVLALLGGVDATLRQAAADFDFNLYTRTLVDFCNEDLSAFYFDIRKDSLYCDAPTDLRRRANRTVMDMLFHALVRYAAPVLVFTGEEVWSTRFPEGGSVHLLEWPQVPRLEQAGERWNALRELREEVMEAIEPLRREKVVRSGLEAEVLVPSARIPEGFSDADLAALFITSDVSRGTFLGIDVTRTVYAKCGRCWRLLPEVPEDGALCGRCVRVVDEQDAAA